MLPDRLNRGRITDIYYFIFIVDFESLFGDGGDFPLGVVVSVWLVHVDDVFPKLRHLFIIIISTNLSSL